MGKIALMLLGALVLAGCNATAPRQQQQAAYRNVTGDCVKALRADERFASIAQPMAFFTPPGEMPDISLLNNTSRPTDEQSKAIGVYSSARASCISMGRESRRASLPPEAASLLESAYVDSQIRIARLQQGEISFGQALKENMQLDAQTGLRWEELRAKHNAGVAQNRMANQRAFMDGMMLYQQSLPRPTPSINCTSRNSFGTVVTNCN